MRKIVVIAMIIGLIALASTAVMATEKTYTCKHSGRTFTTNNLDQPCKDCGCGVNYSNCIQ